MANPTPNRAEGVVIFGGPPYETTANQTPLQLFTELAASGPVLYVARSRQASMLRAFFAQRGSAARTERVSQPLSPGLHWIERDAWVLVAPRLLNLLPLVRPEFSRRIAMATLGRALRRAISQIGLKRPTLVSYWWMFPEISAWPLWRRTIFDVIDLHWAYEQISSSKTEQRNLKLSLETARIADTVSVVSEAIAVAFIEYEVEVRVLRNAAPLARIAEVTSESNSRVKRRAVYVGGWNSRVDGDLVRRLASANPGWSFLFGGSWCPDELADLPNVEFLGPLSYEAALRLMASAEVGIVPFVSNSYTQASNFLKVLDYLACGLTVVATDLESLREISLEFPEHVALMRGESDWLAFFGNPNIAPPLAPDAMQAWGTESRSIKLLDDDCASSFAPSSSET